MMKTAPTRLFSADGPHHAAVVSIEPSSWGDERVMIRIARGVSFKKLTKGTVYGPYLPSEIDERFEEAVNNLAAEGFVPATHMDQLIGLKSKNSARRARAALILGWKRATETVEPLIAASEAAIDDVCSIVDALGSIGDASAIPTARKLAERKLLSRRRSGVEALRKLGDTEGIAQARQRGIERLPQSIVDILGTLDEEDEREATITPLVNALLDEPLKRQGVIIDTLYEAGTPAMVAAARMALRKVPMGRPHLWRYTKSVMKRSMLRHDAETFGWLAHAVETGGRSYSGTKGKVKSGYDGVKRKTTIFSRRTVNYMRRASWRYLARLAQYRPELYAPTAAEALVHYTPSDGQIPKGLNGSYADCYLLNRILWGRSSRLRWDARSMKYKFTSVKEMSTTPPGGGEDAFPELWEAQPMAYLRLLSAAKLPEVQEFGLEGVKRHPEVISSASGSALVGMLDSDATDIVDLAAAELERRFAQEDPDFNLIEALLAHQRQSVWSIASRWLEQHPQLWNADTELVVRLLVHARGASLLGFAQICVNALGDADPGVRTKLAMRLLEELRKPATTDDLHQGFAIVAREALIDELDPLLSINELLDVIQDGSNPAKTVAAAVLGQRHDGLKVLGIDGAIGLSESEIVAVRAAAQTLLASGLETLKSDPSALFSLVESRWEDNRKAAFSMFREHIEFSKLGIDGVIGLCDATQADVQSFGRDLVKEHFEEIDVQDLLFKLAEHPDRQMKKFALELIKEHLKDGYISLAKIEHFCRDCLFDLWPERALKMPLVDFLLERGLRDERQAELVASILNDFVRTNTRSDFEKVAEALVKIQLEWPDVKSDLALAASRSDA